MYYIFRISGKDLLAEMPFQAPRKFNSIIAELVTSLKEDFYDDKF